MIVRIKVLPEFARRAKTLAKRYRSFISDYESLLASLSLNPTQGTPLGDGIYKVRMQITSKRKGKSGGARVLTYYSHQISPDTSILVLMSIYDKSDMTNVSDIYIKEILSQAKREINQ